MTDEAYFFDSYAIIEVLKQNEAYKPYINSQVITTKLNLFEIFYNILKDRNEKEANEVLGEYALCVVDYGKEIIAEAAKFRLLHKKRDLSMTDCIGYITAKRFKIKFLTGDKEFKDFPNVEFVK